MNEKGPDKMSDFGNTISNAIVDAISDDYYNDTIHDPTPMAEQEPTMTEQESTMTPTPSLTEQEQKDMNAISDAFDRARNAVIASSQLAKDVAALSAVVNELRMSVEGLQRDLTESRQRNAVLNDHLISARAQRDEAWNKAAGLRDDCDQLNKKVAEQEGEIISQRSALTSTGLHLEELANQRDEASNEVLALRKERDILKEKLAKIEAAFDTIFEKPQLGVSAPTGSQENW